MNKKIVFLMVFVLCGCTRILIPAEDETIIMQHPVTREVIYCYPQENYPAYECADTLEEQGFVRLKDKSVFPGSDDIIQKGSYPTRRYRDKQDIPRW